MMTKVVINKQHGGFGLSDAAYERMIELGIPVQPYYTEHRDPATRLYKKDPMNDGEVIYDDDISEEKSMARRLTKNRYWECWTGNNRTHPVLVQVVEELGDKANGLCADLKVVEIPDGVDFEIQEYDGREWIAEAHRTCA